MFIPSVFNRIYIYYRKKSIAYTELHLCVSSVTEPNAKVLLQEREYFYRRKILKSHF